MAHITERPATVHDAPCESMIASGASNSPQLQWNMLCMSNLKRRSMELLTDERAQKRCEGGVDPVSTRVGCCALARPTRHIADPGKQLHPQFAYQLAGWPPPLAQLVVDRQRTFQTAFEWLYQLVRKNRRSFQGDASVMPQPDRSSVKARCRLCCP